MLMQKLFVVLFVLANLILPFVIEEVFPITTAPMFRDNPQVYCDFTVLDPSGTALPLSDFDMQRVYDGNPAGYGSGRLANPSLDRFGISEDPDLTIPSRDEIRLWTQDRLAQMNFPFVTVQVKVIGPVGNAVDVQDSFEVIVLQNPALVERVKTSSEAKTQPPSPTIAAEANTGDEAEPEPEAKPAQLNEAKSQDASEAKIN